MTIIELEQELVTFFAEKLGLEVDKTILRGMLAPELINYVTIKIDTIQTPSSPSMEHYEVELLGRFSARNDALTMMQTLRQMFPCYDCENIKALLPKQNAQIYADHWDGADSYAISCRFEAVI